MSVVENLGAKLRQVTAERDRYGEALETIRDRRPLWDEERALWGAWCAEIAREALSAGSGDLVARETTPPTPASEQGS